MNVIYIFLFQGIPYRNRFHMPIAGNPTDSEYYANRTGNWYSFNMGPVHVLVMDTEEIFNDITQGQLLFIAQVDNRSRFRAVLILERTLRVLIDKRLRL